MRIDPSKAVAWVLVAFAAAALFLLLAEHRAHAYGPLLMLLVPVCLVLLYVATSRAESDDAGNDQERRSPRDQKGKPP